MFRIFYALIAFFVGSTGIYAQIESARLSSVESRITQLEGNARHASAAGAVAFLFGAFCALWAQNSGRSAWLWFFAGLIFSVIAVLVLLSKNAADIEKRDRGGRKPFDLQDFREQ